MKSYKDIDKNIIMNAPEGAMWWCDFNTNYYGLLNNEIYYFSSTWPGCGWNLSDNFKSVYSLQTGRNLGFVESKPIPLPNIEIPWEATENSVCVLWKMV